MSVWAMSLSLNIPKSHSTSFSIEDRAAKFRTVGATATAFVTEQEQTDDVDAGFSGGWNFQLLG